MYALEERTERNAKDSGVAVGGVGFGGRQDGLKRSAHINAVNIDVRIDGVVFAREVIPLNLVEDIGGGAPRIDRYATHINLDALNEGVSSRQARGSRCARRNSRSGEDHADVVHFQKSVRREDKINLIVGDFLSRRLRWNTEVGGRDSRKTAKEITCV